jgi:hypothetical protein
LLRGAVRCVSSLRKTISPQFTIVLNQI